MIQGHRYTFYRTTPGKEDVSTFRANFLFISRRGETPTLHVDNIDCEKTKTTKMTIPLDWITRVENMESICGNVFRLPPDVLYQIDQFI
jgi:hypothetical protein